MFLVSYELDGQEPQTITVEAASEERAIEFVTEMLEQSNDGDVSLLEISAEAI